MEQTISSISKHALFVMADLVIDYGKGENLYTQTFSISQFLIDCWNLSKSDAEYPLLVQKFVEEFDNQDVFIDKSAEELFQFFVETGSSLTDNFEVPPVIKEAIAVHIGNSL